MHHRRLPWMGLRRSWLLAALIGLAAWASPVAADGDESGAADADAKAFQKRVDVAIDRGVAWLKTQQQKGGNYPGFAAHLKADTYDLMDVGLNALVVLTLSHGGVEAKDDAISKCLQFCRFHYAGGNGSLDLKGNNKVTVYVASTLIMALDHVYRGKFKHKPLKKDRYGKPIPPKPVRCKYPGWVRRWIKELAEFLVRHQHASGGWRYPGNVMESESADTDLSNTQYALLALEVASRCGIKVEAATWKKAADYLLDTQVKEGLEAPVYIKDPTWNPGDPEEKRFRESGQVTARGWTYYPGQRAYPTGSMTCAGVTGLCVCKERLWALGKLDAAYRRKIDSAMLAALAWLGSNFRVDTNIDEAGVDQLWHYYYLYGLERAGSKTGMSHMGTHDWYRQGAEHLLAAQEKHGGWEAAKGQERPADHTENAITQTCFALLFLQRATEKPPVPMRPPVVTGGAGKGD